MNPWYRFRGSIPGWDRAFLLEVILWDCMLVLLQSFLYQRNVLTIFISLIITIGMNLYLMRFIVM
ncbi:TPA: hypothetical protein MH691_25640 [Klebsiella pneumoniae]|nr:hypothetical protein DBV09_03830 [Klebsiella pneumoniae]PIJ25418.1 hypothetical protein C630_18060 [Klebsiella pneumoniae subsp. pneumoniae KpO3210]HBX1750806.1 hypothetical protein [Klebsiella pneumoniae subsp. pneumoniae]KSX54710.1 hypothetical protein APT86_06345 [Klebsiella pneumoniae]OVW99282.1 hypothetical protein BME32_12695 [Klebsiella pneumoniae]